MVSMRKKALVLTHVWCRENCYSKWSWTNYTTFMKVAKLQITKIEIIYLHLSLLIKMCIKCFTLRRCAMFHLAALWECTVCFDATKCNDNNYQPITQSDLKFWLYSISVSPSLMTSNPPRRNVSCIRTGRKAGSNVSVTSCQKNNGKLLQERNAGISMRKEN